MSVDDVIRAVTGIPRGPDGPVFHEPWEAQAFAMTLALHGRRLFTWGEWTAVLCEEIGRAQAKGDPDTGKTYYAFFADGAAKKWPLAGQFEGVDRARVTCR